MLPEALRGWESYRDWLEANPEFRGRIVFARLLPRIPPKTVPYQGVFAGVLEALGLKPFAHQREALLLVEEGKNVVMAYSTAAGKSLVFQAPVLKAALEGETSLLLFPTKALAHDQLRRLKAMAEALGVKGIYPYDGDTRGEVRRKAKQEGLILLSNPDMLHFGLLPRHGEFASFLSRLRYLVLDELHAYRGVFGTHVALVLFRLLRLARHYGANPQVIAASATIGNAKEHAEGLTGLPFVELREEVARSERELLVLLPKPLDAKGERRRSPLLEAAYLARTWAEGGIRGAHLHQRQEKRRAHRPLRHPPRGAPVSGGLHRQRKAPPGRGPEVRGGAGPDLHQRPGAGGGHRGAGRRGPGGLPGLRVRLLATGRPGRQGKAKGPGGLHPQGGSLGRVLPSSARASPEDPPGGGGGRPQKTLSSAPCTCMPPPGKNPFRGRRCSARRPWPSSRKRTAATTPRSAAPTGT